MSYILDALKKIEHEKNSKRSDGRVSISNNLFQERTRPPGKVGIWKLVTIIAAASLLTCVGTWYVLTGNKAENLTVLRPSLQPLTAPAAPAAPLPAVPPVQAPPASAAVPIVAPPVASKKRTAEGNAIVVERRPAAPTGPLVQKRAVQTAPAPADITLSGIAWQEEHSNRRAVINGFLLKEGSLVSGARIIEIQADRVHFLSSAGQFEIRLNAVLPAGVKQ